MKVRKLTSFVLQNVARAPRPFLLSVFGITVGIAALSFFLALSLGMQRRVLSRIFPADRLEVKLESGMYSWDYTYPNGVRTQNELIVPAGKPVHRDDHTSGRECRETRSNPS